MLHQPVVDTLSSTLMRMKLKAFNAAAFDAGGDWAFESPGWGPLALHLVVKGEQWLCLRDEKAPRRIPAGDCVLISGGRPFVLTSDPKSRRRKKFSPGEVLKTLKNGVMTINGGGSSLSVGAQFQFEGHLPGTVFARLPPVIHIPASDAHSALLRWTVERFREEFLGNEVGRSLMMSHLAPIMLLQTLRVYLQGKPIARTWLTALANPKLSRAIGAIHTGYEKKWTLEQLASIAGMSRSRFALQFKREVGVAPMDYLTRWRMQIARDLLGEHDSGIGAVAQAVGYGSESAFSVAFTKVVNLRPGAYQKKSANRSQSMSAQERQSASSHF
jgi:AraC-like DNA-binding protein